MKDKIIIDSKTGCHNWIGCKGHNGYGQIELDGKMVYAHRLIYELHTGTKISEGLDVCHHCDNRACVNFVHLFIGTRRDNIQDCVQKGRLNPGHVFGEKHGCSKLTDEQVIEIRSRTESQRKIAEKYDVSQTTIGEIKRRERWRHI